MDPPYSVLPTRMPQTFGLPQFVYRHLVYRHLVYYCRPACRTIIHPTSASVNRYFHQIQLLLALLFFLTNPTSTGSMTGTDPGSNLAMVPHSFWLWTSPSDEEINMRY